MSHNRRYLVLLKQTEEFNDLSILNRLTFTLYFPVKIFYTCAHTETAAWSAGVRFSKVPKLFECISDYIVIFASSKRRRFEARNLTVILIFHRLIRQMKTPVLQNKQVGVLRMAFRVRKFWGTFSGNGSQKSFQWSLHPLPSDHQNIT